MLTKENEQQCVLVDADDSQEDLAVLTLAELTFSWDLFVLREDTKKRKEMPRKR
jgi:hypothetical protein